jgi:hypothetical protein
MTLAHYGGTFNEVYVADLDRSYTDAIFTGERLYVRNLMTGDSMLVYDDTAVVHLATRYAKTTPNAQPQSADDAPPDDPTVVATGETDILDVRGPYALIEHRSRVEHGSAGEHYDTTHITIDLRNGHEVSPEKMAWDSISRNNASVATFPHIWHRTGYDLIANGDSGQGSVSFLLRDALRRSWPVMKTNGVPRVYWLDTPPLNTKMRRALLHAFNSAATYDETVKYAAFSAGRRKPPFHFASFRHI